LAKSISGLITLATPFLTCEPRGSLFIKALLKGALWALVFAVLSYVVIPLALRGLDYSHELGGWLGIVFYIGVLYLELTAAAVICGLWNGLTELVADLAFEKQAKLIAMLTPVHCAKLPLLALRFRADEARLYLALLSNLSRPAPLVFRLFG